MRFCSIPNWLDLPQNIVELIINKLHFVDQIRALAVCKIWRDCKDHVRSSDTLPLVLRHKQCVSDTNSSLSFIFKQHGCPYVPDKNDFSLTCELFNPYLQQVHKVPNSININPCHFLRAFASKQGWLLCYGRPCSNKISLLLCNPFTNDTKWVPARRGSYDMKATINIDPISRECEIFMLDIHDARYLHIDTLKANGQTTEFIVEMCSSEGFCSIVYAKGILYCLFYSCKLYSYNLEDKSWKLLTSTHPKHMARHSDMIKCWLLEINDNLIMVFAELLHKVCKCMRIFRYDWSEMSWVVETGLNSCAIYISGHVAFSAPLKSRSGVKLEGCRVFYLDRGVKCYDVSDEEKLVEIQCEEYSWIKDHSTSNWSFIEPPYLGI